MAGTVITNKSVAPYYDDFDSTKQYTQLLALPGRVAQAREITQIQSTVKNIIKSIGDSILKDGNIIEGCQVIVSSDKHSVTVTAGKIYLGGMVLPVEKTTVTIAGSGTETIGAKLVEYLITETEDSTLKDPAQGYDNFNQPGCHRIQSKIIIVVNDTSSAVISTIVNGEIAVEKYAPEYDIMTQTLARRTYDESGSYIVEGFNTRAEYVDADTYNVVVEAGKAYVLGYELKIPTARRILSNRAKTYSAVEYERDYHNNVQDYALSVDHPFVRSINSVVGVKEVTENYNNSTNTDSRALTQDRVLSIVSVSQNGVNYTVGTDSTSGDCYLYVAGGTTAYIKWNGTANYPVNGSDYQVTYRYRKTYTSGTDYNLVLKNGGHYLRWLDGGDTPENSTAFNVNFSQYLARKDAIYMDRYGNISMAVGTPAEYGHDVLPEVPLNTLTLATITNPPNGSAVVSSDAESIGVANIGLTRFTMNDIQEIVNRLNTMEYEQATLSLNNDARNDDTTGKKGIYTDPLVDLSRIDFLFNKLNGVTVDASKPIFDMAIDLKANIAYLPIISNTNSVVYNSSSSTTKKYDRLVTLNTTGERVVLSQMSATKSFLINPYSMFPQLPEVSVTPAVDSWIDDTIIEVPVSIQQTSVVSMTSRTIDNTGNYTGWLATQYRTNSTTSVSDTSIGTSTSSYIQDSVLSQSAVTYIRRRTLTVEGSDFPANLDNIKGYFDGVLVALTPIEGTSSGTINGTVKSDANGHLKATFMIPDKVLTGTREVLLKSETTRDGYLSEGFAIYTAQGTARTIRRTVTTVTTVLLERTTTTTLTSVYVDPIGQTFVLDKMSMIKGIDLYFESKPTTSDTPVICEIREVSNGTITSQVYAHKSLQASSVNTSATGATATRFNFDDPVLLEENKEYAFVVRSASDDYTIWVAEVGGTEISTANSLNPQKVMKNPYMTGVMMSSSNNSSWTTHQTTDVKFRLVEDIYSLSSVVQFNNLSLSQFSRIYLTADSAVPAGTSISWSYSLDGYNYKTLSPYEIVVLSSLYTSLTFRASLNRDTTVNLSPMIALDTVYANTSCYDTVGYYTMKNVSGIDGGFTNIKVIVDTYEPTGTSINVKYSTNNGTTIVSATKQTSPEPRSYDFNWKENTYTATVSSSTQFRIFIEATTNSKAITPAFRRLRVIVS